MDIRELETRGFVRAPYPADLRAAVAEAVSAWQAFCALPEDIKKRIRYSGDLNVSGVGYELKLERGEFNDLKEDFHIRQTERDFLAGEAAKVGLVAERFLASVEALSSYIDPLVSSFAERVEDAVGLDGFAADTREKMPRALFRFLHYFGDRAPGELLAVPHVDKGGFTLHLHESHPGLEHLTYDGVWEPMDFSTGETAIIPAMRMQYRSENRLKATCHRVVANEETARIGRFSAVCFMDFSHTPFYDKAKHGRLQNMPAGFNYRMPFAEFAKLFTA